MGKKYFWHKTKIQNYAEDFLKGVQTMRGDAYSIDSYMQLQMEFHMVWLWPVGI